MKNEFRKDLIIVTFQCVVWVLLAHAFYWLGRNDHYYTEKQSIMACFVISGILTWQITKAVVIAVEQLHSRFVRRKKGISATPIQSSEGSLVSLSSSKFAQDRD